MRLEIPDEDYYTGRIMPFNVSEKGRSEIREVIRLLQEAGVRGRVLDLACGPGLNVAALREAGYAAFGADYSPKGIQIALREVGGGFMNLDAHHLAFRDGVFEGLVITHAIGHVAEPDQVLAEASRVLAAGGAMVVTTPNRRYIEVYRVFNEKGLIPYRRDTTVLRYYDLDDLTATLAAAGFTVRSAVTFGDLPVLEERLLRMGLLPGDVRLDDENRRERLIALVTKECP
ncbi:MAG: class I SAM-dependent methyltransferase [Deltaproteobacteria bacterium]|nr:class I SAM-dependent methyltransferase [Deltaproteobacteria bacterium]